MSNNQHNNYKQIKYGREAREALAKGINTVANAVRVTLGPGGRLVVLARRWGVGTVTKDGVSVAREVQVPDPFENEGAKQCTEVASKSNVDAGDGTTTATVLAQALVNTGLEDIENRGKNSVHLTRELEEDLDKVLEFIDRHSTPVTTQEDVQHIATISGNDPEIGKNLSKAFAEVGADGVVSLETWKGDGVKLDFAEGYQFERGYMSPYFVNNPQRMRAEYEDPIVLVVCQSMRWAQEAAKCLEICVHHKRPMVVVCEDCEGEALETFLVNRVQGPQLPVVVVKGPGFGNRQRTLLEDLAVFVGATPIATELGMDFTGTIPPTVAGSARRVTVDSENCTIIDGGGSENLAEHCAGLRTLLEQVGGDNETERLKLQERLTKLTSGACVVRVGASTETELTELKHRYEDALNATRAALREGVVPGGGMLLVQASKVLDEGSVLRRALSAPFWQIVENAGHEPGPLLEEALAKDGPEHGFDARTGQWVDLKAAGIIDPVLVAKSSLKNAVSIAKLVLNCETVIVDLPTPNNN